MKQINSKQMLLSQWKMIVFQLSSFGGRLGWAFFFFLLFSCTPIRYIGIETFNPASLTFPREMRRVLIVNNAVAQQDVPFESEYRHLPDSVNISADSTTFDFCLALGEAIAAFAGFDDVRLLEDGFRSDQQPFAAPVMTQADVVRLCDEHEVEVVISLDRLLFRVKEYADYAYGAEMIRAVDVEVAGVVRVYLPNRTNPLTTIELADTITPVVDVLLVQNNRQSWDIVFATGQTNLLRESAKFLAEEARIYFMPYWREDIRWYYTAADARWKEASAYAVSERWDKAVEVWRTLYDRTSSWKRKARLASNLAVGTELTGDLDEALKYAEQAHRLLSEHLGKDDPTVKRHEHYVDVLSNRILEEQRLRLQMNH